jgi:hypothetical protein
MMVVQGAGFGFGDFRFDEEGEVSHCQQVKQIENKKVRRFHRLSGFCGKTHS